LIIDCHGHYTTAPKALQDFRDAQVDGTGSAPTLAPISDDELRASVESQQVAKMTERGIDLTLFSPRASSMEHHRTDPATARDWARVSNDLVHRVVTLYPDRFVGACQLPQTPDGALDDVIAELRRCVDELEFVGCNLNPDPSGGYWTGKPLTDPYWFPLYEALVDLDVPAMIHVSASCNANFHALGAHYLNADTAAFMQLLEGDLFARFPTLRLVIPHGGGAVPYHWGRFRGLADRLGRPPLDAHLMRNVFFDTCVYHQAGVDLLTTVIDPDNILFASEAFGAVRGVDPVTGHHWDDTKRYVDRAELDDEARQKVFEGNARRVYPRLDARLAAASWPREAGARQ
jgi:4-oxalmesaconate hydratase